MFTPDDKTAKPGDIIEFEKNDRLMEGQVLPSNCKNSIIVDISSMHNLEEINHGFESTVVSHKKYRVK